MSLKKYQHLSIDELIEHPEFSAWIRESSEEQNKYWETYLKANPAEATKLENAKKIVLGIDLHYKKGLPDSNLPDPEFAKLLTNIVRLDQTEQQRTLTKPKVQRRWAIAAAIALLLSVGLWFLVNENTNSLDNWVVYKTEFGEWKKLQLPDGSTVHLNAHSTLKLKDNWMEGAHRQVWLKGEAFFEVEKKPSTKAKFRVITDALAVEVLGTMFNVNAQGANTKVFLEEGKIELTTPTKKLALQPNEYIDYTKGTKSLKVENKTIKDTGSSWKDGTLILTQQTVADILQRLEEIYGYTFEVKQKNLLAERKTLAIPMTKIEIVLPILERTIGVESKKEGNRIMLN